MLGAVCLPLLMLPLIVFFCSLSMQSMLSVVGVRVPLCCLMLPSQV